MVKGGWVLPPVKVFVISFGKSCPLKTKFDKLKFFFLKLHPLLTLHTLLASWVKYVGLNMLWMS